jgi:hypothetical protein
MIASNCAERSLFEYVNKPPEYDEPAGPDGGTRNKARDAQAGRGYNYNGDIALVDLGVVFWLEAHYGVSVRCWDRGGYANS